MVNADIYMEINLHDPLQALFSLPETLFSLYSANIRKNNKRINEELIIFYFPKFNFLGGGGKR